jgi:hypothetical protein
MSFSWQYTLSNPTVKGVGKVSRSAAAMTTFWMVYLMVDGGGNVPSTSPGVGEVYLHRLLYLKRRFVVV